MKDEIRKILTSVLNWEIDLQKNEVIQTVTRQNGLVDDEVWYYGSVAVDPDKLLQILVNLIENAREAVAGNPPDERLVRISAVGGDADAVVIAVKDNGMGIDPTNLDRMFQHGFTTKPEGHGFGLHRSFNLAQEMGGHLSVHGDGLGSGAEFRINLPLRQRKAA